MKTNNNDLFGPDGPAIETPVALRFLIKRYDEMLEQDRSKIPLAFQGLSLCAASHDEEGYAELHGILLPAAQVKRCRDILVQMLARTEARTCAERPDAKVGEEFPSLPERAHRQVLVTALREGKKVIAENNFEFDQIIRLLGWIALRPYPRRMAEFEDVWNSSQDDPGVAARKAVAVLWTAFRHKDAVE